MRRSFALAGFAAAILGCATIFAAVPNGPSVAASGSATFVVPANDGYGVAECSSSSCGQVVADQWCAAQGFSRSVSFGVVDVEVTGSIARAAADSRPISITCGE